jgi:5'-nucleotidase
MIANDDGIQARGLRYLIDCVVALGIDADIYAVAPQGHCSGMSSAITVDKPLRVIQHPDYNGAHMFAVTGTPVDCVKLGMHAVMPRRPDLMLSGVNHGSNSGNSNIYSGTMGAAMEACMIGIPSIGFSLLSHDPEADFSQCGEWIQRIISMVLTKGLPEQVCLNVNMPKACTPKGVKVTACAKGCWVNEYADYVDPFGRKFYWLTGKYENHEPENPLGDNHWLEREYITVTPIRPDQTAFDAIALLKNNLNEA